MFKKSNIILLSIIILIFSIAGLPVYDAIKEEKLESISGKLRDELNVFSTSLVDSVLEMDSLGQQLLGSNNIKVYLSNIKDSDNKLNLDESLVNYIEQKHLQNVNIESIALLDRDGDLLFYNNFFDDTATFYPSNRLKQHIDYVLEATGIKGIARLKPTLFQYAHNKATDKLILTRTFSPEQEISNRLFPPRHKLYHAVITVNIQNKLQVLKKSLDGHVALRVLPKQSVYQFEPNLNQIKMLVSNNRYGYIHSNNMWELELSVPDSYLDNLYKSYNYFFVIFILLTAVCTFILLKWLFDKRS